MSEVVELDRLTSVATLVGKALRQRLGAEDVVTDGRGVRFIGEVDEAPYWLQEVKVDGSYREPPVITDHLGHRYRVLVERLPCCERDHDGDGNCDRHPEPVGH